MASKTEKRIDPPLPWFNLAGQPIESEGSHSTFNVGRGGDVSTCTEAMPESWQVTVGYLCAHFDQAGIEHIDQSIARADSITGRDMDRSDFSRCQCPHGGSL